jgi:uncharacterized protein YbcC (UPF0753/DUF2309 family)
VVGGRIGVFEGNSGDLRIGLSSSLCMTAANGVMHRCGWLPASTHPPG